MNAQILRKWSPFKSLMYLWLIFLVLFSIIWCPGALAMHLAPVLKLTPFNRQQQSQPQQNYISLEDGSAQNYSSFSSYSRSKHNLNNINNDNPSRSELDQKLLTTHLHQITNNKNNNSNHHSYYSSLALPLSPDSNIKTEQEVKKSNEIARWRHRMNEKRARILYDRRKLLSNNNTESSDITSRNRRESLTQNPHNNPLRQDREHRRYCSGRDPAVLAFEAPTVFEGKIKSMSHVRRTNYAVTFECVHVYKQPAGFTIPPKVRLNFQTTDNRTECDIYRQDFKQRGQIRGDVLEQGKLYFLFVKQIDVGNFTILGQPIRKTKKTEKEVRLGASSDYGKRAEIASLTANVTVKEHKRIRLVCRVNGQPPPKVTWFKDGKSLSRLRRVGGAVNRGERGTKRERIKIEQFRTRSRLIIESAALSDAGVYECRAKNKVDRRYESKLTEVKVLPNRTSLTSSTSTSYTRKPEHYGEACVSPWRDVYCLNGGQCVTHRDLDEKSCFCAEGFSGKRCEHKDPGSHQASTYSSGNNKKECGNGYIGGYYC